MKAPLYSASFLGAAMLALLLLTPGCNQQTVEPTRNSIEPGTVIHLPAMEWHIVSKPELDRAYVRGGGRIVSGHQLEGFTSINHTTGAVQVYTLPPTRVDGAATLTLGHEVMHVALGDYHKKIEEK